MAAALDGEAAAQFCVAVVPRQMPARAVRDAQPVARDVVVLVPVDGQVEDAAVVDAVRGEQQVLVGVREPGEDGRPGDRVVVGVGARRHALQDRPLHQHELADPVHGGGEEDRRACLVPLADRGLDRGRVVGVAVALRSERQHRDGSLGVTGHDGPPRSRARAGWRPPAARPTE